MSAVVVAALVLSGCRLVTVGQPCRTTDLARDNTHVLVCRNGRWISTGLTVAQALRLIQNNRATTTSAAVRSEPTTTSSSPSSSTTTSTTVAPTPMTASFDFTGATQQWTVPAGVTSISVTAWGGHGGVRYYNHGVGGRGANVSGTIAVTPGAVLDLIVAGDADQHNLNAQGTAGFGGGGTGSYAGGGGGASRIQIMGSTILVVAGGGGGAGSHSDWCTNPSAGNPFEVEGGAGGDAGSDGAAGLDCFVVDSPAVQLVTGGGGRSGTPGAGGAGGDSGSMSGTSACALTGFAQQANSADNSGSGAAAHYVAGGAGGGGYQGGGAGGSGFWVDPVSGACGPPPLGTSGGGGGGASYTIGSATNVAIQLSSRTAGSNGRIIISYSI